MHLQPAGPPQKEDAEAAPEDKAQDTTDGSQAKKYGWGQFRKLKEELEEKKEELK